MRGIKFRAWDSHSKNFTTAVFSSDPFEYLIVQKPEDMDLPCQPRARREQKLDWQQFTGLKDKNGVEIYEGDILRHSYMTDEDDPAEPDVGYLGSESVKYAVGEVKISPYLGSYLKLRSGSIRRVTRHRVTGGEVIGNVHEHGHLMEVTS